MAFWLQRVAGLFTIFPMERLAVQKQSVMVTGTAFSRGRLYWT
jgi:hypothetical protein